MMKTDAQLRQDVEAELEWDPAVHANKVGVVVDNGVVTLSGHLDSYAEKHAIEKAVRGVSGVRGIALELDVKLDPAHKRADSEIVAAAERAFAWHTLVPADRITVIVENGWISLKGEVDWDYQRREAEQVVRTLRGVVGVSNAITLKTRATPSDVSRRIHDALVRHAVSESKRIEVSVNNGQVLLRGAVDSWAERASAYRAAWAAPGVNSVISDLRVQP